MRINQYEFRQNGVEFEPTKQQIVQFATDQLAKDDKKIKNLETRIEIYEKSITEFIEELAWLDIKYNALMSSGGEFEGSRSAIPEYAKKYFDLWQSILRQTEKRGEKNEINTN